MGGQNPYCMYMRIARSFLDAEHDFVLERSAMKYSRLKVSIAFRWESESLLYVQACDKIFSRC